MARILVCADGFFRFFSPIALEPYIEMFINSLVENGNQVMPYITFDIAKKGKKIVTKIREKLAYNDVKNFDPEIIFTFNNAIDERFLKNFDCPCYIIASDTPKFWNKKNLISKYRSKYKVLYFNGDFKDELNDLYKINYNKQFLIPYTTDIKFENLEKNKDIIFCGNFYNPNWKQVYTDLIYKEDKSTEIELILKEIICCYKEKHSIDDVLYKRFIKFSKRKKIKKEELEAIFCILFTNKKRLMYLRALLDFDIHLYSWDSNWACIDFDYSLFEKCHLERVYSAITNQKIYNESKISLNLPHEQVKTGFSWRVCDIMASSSMLLTNKTDDIVNLFGDIVPTYSNENELRDKCLYYLKNDRERLEIVAKSNEIINKNHRFINLLVKLEEYTGLKLINKGEKGIIKNICWAQKQQEKYYEAMELKR